MPSELDFSKLKNAVTAQWARMLDHDLYRTNATGDQLWDTYLASFPAGTNPIFRKRTEHDCSCCRHFIRSVGNVVAVIDGELVSIWDCAVKEPAYQTVVDAMAQATRTQFIQDAFLYPETHAGTDKSFENLGDGEIRTWGHFHVDIPNRRNSGRNYYLDKHAIPTVLGEKRTTHDVLDRGLREITKDAILTVLEVSGSLYRGNEFREQVSKFDAIKTQFDLLPAEKREAFVWQQSEHVHASVARTRNTAIGTLLLDLSAGTDLEAAVRKFEISIMAPTNYKRPTALVSQKMVDDARRTVEELGLTSALARRHANLTDVSVNDVLFADRSVRPAMRDGMFEGITTRSTPKNLDRVETVPIAKFLEEIVPAVTSIEVLLENRHAGNLVSLIGPVSRDAPPILKWDNGFSWSYNGDVADSIRERVKKAGGNVTGDLCCRLSWHNFDDLDLHLQEPAGGARIFYANKMSLKTGGELDVDMNAGHGHTREPVENIFYPNRKKMFEGIYKLDVNQYHQREISNPGFEVELDWLGTVTSFTYDKAVRGTITVAKFRYTHANGLEIIESLPSRTASRELWGLKSNDFHRVSALMLSPNHWNGSNGNKHFFFMLNDCVNDGTARGFYNEFLRPELDKHRKVIEIVGSKSRTEQTPNQLSGLGFSETQRAELTVRVTGTYTRILKVLF